MNIQDIFKSLNPKPVRNQWRMKCPFRENHDSATPGDVSFFITPEINAYHCFSCKAKGGLLGLLTTRFGVPFMDAIEMVSFDNIERLLNPLERKVFEIDEIIPMNPPAQFIKRGFSERLLRQFKIGSDGKHIYTPVYDSEGLHIIAIKHRVDHNFWYTPAGFPKENFLYNYHRVNGKYKTAILVEGETDVMNSCKNNFWNVVAQSGGELSDEQAKLLSVFDCVYFALDNDSAGTRYTECAYEKMKPYGTEIKVMLYDAADPGSCEKEKWMLAYEEAVSFAEYRFGMSMEFQQDYDKYIKKSRR